MNVAMTAVLVCCVAFTGVAVVWLVGLVIQDKLARRNARKRFIEWLYEREDDM